MPLSATENLKGYWQVRVYDTTGKLVDLPQADIESIQLEDVLNGGSGSATVQFKRNYNQIGAIAFGYTVLIWIWPPGAAMPTDPYYAGHIVDFDQEQLSASGRVTAKIEGDAKLLDAAIVTEQVNPGISGNPNLDAGIYISHLLSTYQPANFAAATVPGTMFNMFPTNFDGAKLGAAIDTVSKQGRDLTGALWTWFVRTKADLTRRVVVQVDQNPNQIGGLTFKHLFVGSMLDQYKIQNVYRNIINIVAVYGAKDPTTGQQVYGVFQDAASVAAYTALEDKISVPALLTAAGCQAYATVWLTLNGYPQAQGSARLLQPDPNLLAGAWVQFWEVPATGIAGAVIKQVRIARVSVAIKGEHIEQTISTTSPVPYFDEAVYRMGLNVSASQAIQNTPISVNKQTLYIRSGGFVTSTGSGGGNGKVAIAATAASFPASQISVAALGPTSLIDNSGGPNNGLGGDGNFTVSLTSAGAYVITKGPRPANSSTQQNLCAAVVSGGTIIAGGITDLRALIAMPALAPGTTPAIASGAAVLTYPNGTGGPTFDAQVVVNLGAAASNAVREIYQIELWVAAHGATNATPQLWAHRDPNASGSYTFLFQQLAAGTQWDLYVGFRDNSGLIGGSIGISPPTNMLLLGTTAANGLSPGALPIINEFGGAINADGSWTNVDAASSVTQYSFAAGQSFSASADIAKGSVGGYAALMLGNRTNGYEIDHDSANVRIVKWVSGTGTVLQSTAISDDTNYHTFRLSILPGSPNTINASIDNTYLTVTDSSLNLASGTWPATLYTGGSTGKVQHYTASATPDHWVKLPIGIRRPINEDGTGNQTDFTGAYEADPTGSLAGYVLFPSTAAWRLEKNLKQIDLTKAPLCISGLGRVVVNVNNQHGFTFCNDTPSGGNATNDYEVVVTNTTLSIIMRKGGSQTTLASMAVANAPDSAIDQMLKVMASYDGTTVTIIAQWGKELPLVATDSSSPLTSGYYGVRCVGDTAGFRGDPQFSQSLADVATFAFGSQYNDVLGNITKSTPLKINVPNSLATVGICRISTVNTGVTPNITQAYYLDNGTDNTDIAVRWPNGDVDTNMGHIGNYGAGTGGVAAFTNCATGDIVYYRVYYKHDGGGAGTQSALYVTAQKNTPFTDADIAVAEADGGIIASFAKIGSGGGMTANGGGGHQTGGSGGGRGLL